MSDQTLHRCAARHCPGLGWRASDYPHPASCNVPPDAKGHRTDSVVEPWPTATDAGVATEVATVLRPFDPSWDGGSSALWPQIITDAQRADLRENERNDVIADLETANARITALNGELGLTAATCARALLDRDAANARITQLEHDLAFARECEVPQAATDARDQERAAVASYFRRKGPMFVEMQRIVYEGEARSIEAGAHTVGAHVKRSA